MSLTDERGSISPLLIGLGSVSLAVLLTVSTSMSLYVQQKRLTTQAEAVALAHADNLSAFLLLDKPAQSTVTIKDGETVEVRICSAFSPPIPLGSALKSLLPNQQVCGRALARLAP